MNAKLVSSALLTIGFTGCATVTISHPPDLARSSVSPGEVGVIGVAFASSEMVLESDALLVARSEAFVQGLRLGCALPVSAFIDSGAGQIEYLGGALFLASLAVSPVTAVAGGICGLTEGVSRRDIPAAEAARVSLDLREDLGNALAAKLARVSDRKFRRMAEPVSEREISRPHRVVLAAGPEANRPAQHPTAKPLYRRGDAAPLFGRTYAAGSRERGPGLRPATCDAAGCVHTRLAEDGVAAVLNFSTIRFCLRRDLNDEKPNALLALSILMCGRLTGATDGREIGTVIMRYESSLHRNSEWIASDSQLLRAEWAKAMDSLSSQVVVWLSPPSS